MNRATSTEGIVLEGCKIVPLFPSARPIRQPLSNELHAASSADADTEKRLAKTIARTTNKTFIIFRL
jgi:hypothetical protein